MYIYIYNFTIHTYISFSFIPLKPSYMPSATKYYYCSGNEKNVLQIMKYCLLRSCSTLPGASWKIRQDR